MIKSLAYPCCSSNEVATQSTLIVGAVGVPWSVSNVSWARNLATEPRLHAHPMPRGGVNGHGVLHGASEGTKKGEKPKVFIWSWGVVNQQATKAR